MKRSAMMRSAMLAFLMISSLGARTALAQSSATGTIAIQAAVGATFMGRGFVNASQGATETALELRGCTFSTPGINFGNVSGQAMRKLAPASRTVQGSLTVSCGSSAGAPGSFGIQVGLDDGANAAAVSGIHLPPGSTAARAMKSGHQVLAYSLLKPAVGLGLVFSGTAPTQPLKVAGSEWGAQQASGNGLACDVPGSSIMGNLLCLVSESGAGLAFILPPQILVPLPLPAVPFITIPITATIPGGQFQPLPPGIYTDTVTITITFI